ncbi:iron-sulfur assembly protein IscA, chloroplastic isoform X2 [Manihot esculenta]|uniref:iron-sulfur assembly protein IscA, chloroplastic isoform X2 n=1 Tax=Manihot esculenta TaxID=3983 RepID=UPI000B5D6289|nr:iron-sulfur assembly protein IscA, chloroplastic isoform X2 [Manihot esculenta]XP_043805596.1 iron-sulfur assembly protein IscA, chloroplastic isoform X2 [Manihot esculenta]
MAFSASITMPHSPLLRLRLPCDSNKIVSLQNSLSFPFSRSNLSRRLLLSVRSTSSAAVPATEGIAPAISLTDSALKHLNKMRKERDEDLCLRIGVKQGGCSGMSYTMEFENRANARPDDSIIEYNGFVIASLLCARCWADLGFYMGEVRGKDEDALR